MLNVQANIDDGFQSVCDVAAESFVVRVCGNNATQRQRCGNKSGAESVVIVVVAVAVSVAGKQT